MDTQLDCAPDRLRSTWRAGETHDLARLPEGWVCGRNCDIGGTMEVPVTVDYVLMHPRHGVALIDLREPGHNAEGVLRQRLEETGFHRIFTGYLPVIHGTLLPSELPVAVELVGAAFAELPPLTIGAGKAWVKTLERSIVPGDRVWTDNLDGAPRGWRDEALAMPRPPEAAIVSAATETTPHWSATVLQVARDLTAEARRALQTTVLPLLRSGAREAAVRLAQGAVAAWGLVAAFPPRVRWAAAGSSALALVALLALPSPAPTPVPAAPPVTAAVAAPEPAPAAPPVVQAASVAPNEVGIADQVGLAELTPAAAALAAPMVAAGARPAPRSVSFSQPRQPSAAEQRREALRARRAARVRAEARAQSASRRDAR
ncbi:hypothetical protein [Muricoccus aerilatus]|uniref:hypothetical protein n=1 Tax=Muricoccus aerilatus TaxID=452982 RepID=UPI0005C1D727|nr:hypothetical protein [Roseomonas aerilata]